MAINKVCDRQFLEQLWALPLDDSKTAEQKIKEVEDKQKKDIVRDITYIKTLDADILMNDLHFFEDIIWKY